MGFGEVQACFPVRMQRPNVEFGNQHAHHSRQGNLPNRQMTLVEFDFAPGQRIELRVQGFGTMEMREIWTCGIGLPVVDKEFSVVVIE